MAKQARSYANLTLGRPEQADAEEQADRTETPSRTETRRQQLDRIVTNRRNSLGRPKKDGLGDDGKTVKQKAAQWMTYLHPEAVLAIKRFALDSGQKPMDCSIEAFTMWFESKGIKVPVRVRSEHYGVGDKDGLD